MNALLSLVRALPELGEIAASVASPGETCVVTGAVGPLPGLLAAGILAQTGRPVLLVAPDEKTAEAAASDAAAAGAEGVFAAPEPTLSPYQRVAPSLNSRRRSLALLAALSERECRLAVVPARFLLQKLPSPATLAQRRLALEAGGAASLPAIAEFLAREGYARTDLVTEAGDFAVRGGIVDAFPGDSAHPVRIELDGDTVASLRWFDPDTQRSRGAADRVVLRPLAAAADDESAEERLASWMGRAPTPAERAVFLPAAAGHDATLFAHAPDAALAVIEPALTAEALRRWAEQVGEDYDPARDPVPPAALVHELPSVLGALAERAAVAFDRLGLTPGRRVAIAAEEVPGFDGRVREAAEEVHRAVAARQGVLLAAGPRGGSEKARRFLAEYALSSVEIVPATVSAGVRLREAGILLLTEEQIFGAERPASAALRRAADAFLSDLRDLKAGDFVVHVEYGIGRFRGVRRIAVEGAEREFVEVGYAQDRHLLLPVERMDLIQKYAGAEGAEPRLDRLGGAGWERRKEAARKAVRDLSQELLELYARRAQARGFAFSKDSPWQKEFEDAFEHTETPDQERAIAEVKRDMERPAPMDRLLCGDVGYGKTEVAMRAAFKAVLDGKQVAVLAPTTILADQHYRTFTRRFAAFPVTIELLSRFREPRQQKETLARLAEGTVDIVIATHRLLSRDIRFRDLGLLIVDEEQRFGVAQKEKVKRWKASVDVLSMSATPIPRSLHMAISGLRDLSVIETPPRDRLAVETQVVPKSGEVVREAIAFERGRGGQVFYVHNRVESIGAEARLLAELLPDARVAVAHGQMSEAELSRTMRDFIAHKYDILLATSIVENGLDIPSVNTILIDRAHTFGLAQLYQLRGRVGRSDKAAYCYLLVPPEAALSEIARARLATIREFCDLGAGFRIAARDLEIRGAGNILGAEQSGHIAAVGLEMYMSLLEEAMREMSGEEPPVVRGVTIALGQDLAIPPAYLPDENLRLSLYKRIARARDDRSISEIVSEIADRYGPPPEAVSRLAEFARLRRRAEELGVKAIERRGATIRLAIDEKSRIDPGRLAETVARWAGARLVPPGTVEVPAATSLSDLIELLDRLAFPEAA